MKKILMVDDDQQLREFVETDLRAAGYAIRTADNGRSALEMALQWQPDLIIMDLEMPVMDGVTAIHEIRKTGYSGKVAVLAANLGGGNARKAKDAGADLILAKPFSHLPNIMVQKILHE